MVLPGLSDSHVHSIDGGIGITAIQLRDAEVCWFVGCVVSVLL